MSCGSPHETDCAKVLEHVSLFLEHDLRDSNEVSYKAIEQHLIECGPCMSAYGGRVAELQQALRIALSRCCHDDHAPDELRLRVMQRIQVTVTEQRG